MGMFDKPQYLTGEKGLFNPGDTFWLHDAKLEGYANINGEQRPQAKLLVSVHKAAEQVVVYTSGVAIVNQVRRMDASDREAMPMEVRLDAIPAAQPGRNATNVLTPADEPVATGGVQEPLAF